MVQKDYDSFAAETNYGKTKHIKIALKTQAERYQNLYERYSHVKPSDDPLTNMVREAEQNARLKAVEYLSKKDKEEKGCLVILGIVVAIAALGMCSIL